MSPGGSAAPKPSEPPKPPLGRAYAEMLEKEAALTRERQELKPLMEARELIKQGKRLKALELLGTNLDEVNVDYLNESGRQKTPEEIARAAAAAEYEARDKARKDAEAETTRQQQEAQQAQTRAQVSGMVSQLDGIVPSLAGQLDATAALGVTTTQVLQWWVNEHKAWPTDPKQVLVDFEAHQSKQLEARGFRKAAPAPAPGTQPIGAIGGQPASRGTTSAITPADAGEVPLRRQPNGKPLTAMERSRLVMQELGIPD